MKRLVFIGLLVLIGGIGIYLLWPGPKFPDPPPGSLQSREPGDNESIYRRGYFTNLTREEIMHYYDQQLRFPLQFRRKIPPEYAHDVIRDQTKSSYIEELVHPWRDSLYINGYVPIKDNEQIYREGVHYLNKVTIHFFPSHQVTRLTVLALTLIVSYWLIKEYGWA